MKILKLVLIAIVTVSIYSFTTKTIPENVNFQREITQVKQLRIYFLPGQTSRQRQQVRLAIKCRYSVTLDQLIESTETYETWTYITPPGQTNGNVSSGGSDEEEGCEETEHIIVNVRFNFDPNTPTFRFN